MEIRNLGDSKFGTPEKNILQEETSTMVRKAMDSLPDRLRSILLMREFEDMTYEEIADTLECPVGTVRSRLSRARRFLRDKLYEVAVNRGVLKPARPARELASTRT